MIVEVYAGTPHEGETKRYSEAGPAKNFLTGRVTKQARVAEKFDAELHRRLGSIRQQIDSCALQALKTGEERTWSATDEYTGVTFVYKIKKVV